MPSPVPNGENPICASSKRPCLTANLMHNVDELTKLRRTIKVRLPTPERMPTNLIQRCLSIRPSYKGVWHKLDRIVDIGLFYHIALWSNNGLASQSRFVLFCWDGRAGGVPGKTKSHHLSSRSFWSYLDICPIQEMQSIGESHNPGYLYQATFLAPNPLGSSSKSGRSRFRTLSQHLVSWLFRRQ